MALEGKLGKYEIVELIGRGAMGNVYKALDTKMFDREVALKVLPPDLSDDKQALLRFMREIEVVAKLSHPNIITIHDWGQEDDRQYFVMEYINGFDLTRLIVDQTCRDLEQRVDIAVQICDGLSYAHDHKVIHRDIKPANIMIDSRSGKDHVKLVDFGIVHIDRSGLTLSGSQPGTMRYMSPEQLNASPIDARSDLFSLGLVLYELFAGRHPHDAPSDPAVALEIMRQPAESARSTNGDLPEALDRVLLQLLEKDREKRPASARQTADRLREVHQQLVASRPATDPSVRVPATAPPATPPAPAGVAAQQPRPPKTGEPQTTPEGLLARAHAALDSGQREEARAELVEAVRRFPEHDAARVMLARLLEIPTNVDLGAYRAALRAAREALEGGRLNDADRECTRAGEIWANDDEWRTLQAEVARRSESEIEMALAKIEELRREAEGLTRRPQDEPQARDAIKRAKRFVNVARAMGAVPSRCDSELTSIDEIEQSLERRIADEKRERERQRERQQELLRVGRRELKKGQRLASEDVVETKAARAAYDRSLEAYASFLESEPDHQDARSERKQAEAGLRKLADRVREAVEDTEAQIGRVRVLVEEQRHREALEALREPEARCAAVEELGALLPEIARLRETAAGTLRRERMKRVGVAGAVVLAIGALIVAGLFGRDFLRGRATGRDLAGAQAIYSEAEGLSRGGYDELQQAVLRATEGHSLLGEVLEREPGHIEATDLRADYTALLNDIDAQIDSLESEAGAQLEASLERARPLAESDDPQELAQVAVICDEAAEAYRGLLGEAAFQRDARELLEELKGRADERGQVYRLESKEQQAALVLEQGVQRVNALLASDDAARLTEVDAVCDGIAKEYRALAGDPTYRSLAQPTLEDLRRRASLKRGELEKRQGDASQRSAAIEAAQDRLGRALDSAQRLLGSNDPGKLSRAIDIAERAAAEYRQDVGADAFAKNAQQEVDAVLRQASNRKRAVDTVNRAIEEARGLLSSAEAKKLGEVAPVCNQASRTWRSLLGSDPPAEFRDVLENLKNEAEQKLARSNKPDPGPTVDVASLRLDFEKVRNDLSMDDPGQLGRRIADLESLVGRLGASTEAGTVALRNEVQAELTRSRAAESVLGLLREWEAAWESLDVDRVQAVWPTMPKRQVSALGKLFRTHDEIRADISNIRIDLDPGSAAGADVTFQWKTANKGKGIDAVQESEIGRRYRVERTAIGWVIVAQLD